MPRWLLLVLARADNRRYNCDKQYNQNLRKNDLTLVRNYHVKYDIAFRNWKTVPHMEAADSHFFLCGIDPNKSTTI